MISVIPNRIRMNFPTQMRAASRNFVRISFISASPSFPHDISYGDGCRGIAIALAVSAAASHLFLLQRTFGAPDVDPRRRVNLPDLFVSLQIDPAALSALRAGRQPPLVPRFRHVFLKRHEDDDRVFFPDHPATSQRILRFSVHKAAPPSCRPFQEAPAWAAA